MNTWVPLWSGTVESSLWDEEDLVVKVFLTMLAVKDADHIVRFNAYQLGRKARKTEIEVLEALKILSSPDTKRIGPQDFDGRRIEAVEDGWLILNAGKYRDRVQVEMKKARDRRAQANARAKKAGQPLPYPSEKYKHRVPSPEQQVKLDAAHADQCASMKRLNGVQQEIESGMVEPEGL